jgi:hypothetical protein
MKGAFVAGTAWALAAPASAHGPSRGTMGTSRLHQGRRRGASRTWPHPLT